MLRTWSHFLMQSLCRSHCQLIHKYYYSSLHSFRSFRLRRCTQCSTAYMSTAPLSASLCRYRFERYTINATFVRPLHVLKCFDEAQVDNVIVQNSVSNGRTRFEYSTFISEYFSINAGHAIRSIQSAWGRGLIVVFCFNCVYMSQPHQNHA